MGALKDWTGQKFNSLTFIRRTEEKVVRTYKWEVLCDCGKTLFCTPTQIVAGTRKSCGCMIKRGKDWAGLKFNKLTFIRPTNKRTTQNDAIWELQCECGNLTYSNVANVVNNQSKTSCGCVASNRMKELCQLARKFPPIISSARRVWQRYNKDGLDFDTFFDLSQQNCYYCGLGPSTIYNYMNYYGRPVSDIQKLNGAFTYNGLDRTDSSKGHTIDNIVPCCWVCNCMKNDLSEEEFYAHIERIHNYQQTKNTIDCIAKDHTIYHSSFLGDYAM
jgi:hypothetical protein